VSYTSTLLHIYTLVFNGVHMYVHASVCTLHKLANLWSIHRCCCLCLQAATTGDYASLLSAAPVIAVTASSTLEQVMEVSRCMVVLLHSLLLPWFVFGCSEGGRKPDTSATQ
jgi:hypothetical protein